MGSKHSSNMSQHNQSNKSLKICDNSKIFFWKMSAVQIHFLMQGWSFLLTKIQFWFLAHCKIGIFSYRQRHFETNKKEAIHNYKLNIPASAFGKEMHLFREYSLGPKPENCSEIQTFYFLLQQTQSTTIPTLNFINLLLRYNDHHF